MLTTHGEAFEPNSSEPLLRQKLKTITQTQHLMWHTILKLLIMGTFLLLSVQFMTLHFIPTLKWRKKVSLSTLNQ